MSKAGTHKLTKGAASRKSTNTIRLKTAKRKTQVSRQRVRSAIEAVINGDTHPVITVTVAGKTIYREDPQYQH